jgi:hypothetical protein
MVLFGDFYFCISLLQFFRRGYTKPRMAFPSWQGAPLPALFVLGVEIAGVTASAVR